VPGSLGYKVPSIRVFARPITLPRAVRDKSNSGFTECNAQDAAHLSLDAEVSEIDPDHRVYECDPVPTIASMIARFAEGNAKRVNAAGRTHCQFWQPILRGLPERRRHSKT